jgi:hypothetical protein
MAIRELYLVHSLNKAGYTKASSFFHYNPYFVEIFKAAYGTVSRPRETKWEFCRPSLDEPPSPGLPSCGLDALFPTQSRKAGESLNILLARILGHFLKSQQQETTNSMEQTYCWEADGRPVCQEIPLLLWNSLFIIARHWLVPWVTACLVHTRLL